MPQEINIRKLIKERAPKVYQFIPGFVFRYLERIVHQEEVNNFMVEHQDKDAIDFAKSVKEKFEVNLTVIGLENIPKTGGCIVICNHPLGGLDAMALVPELAKVRQDIKYIVNDLLLNIEPLKPIFIGVNKTGVNSRESLQEVEQLFATDQLIVLFPSGLVSRRINGKILDLPWKKTFVTKAAKYNLPILPIHIEGGLSSFFYRLSNIRKCLRLKVNIEMLYLANELFKQKGKKVTFTIGKSQLLKDLPLELGLQQKVHYFREELYKLAPNKR